VRAEIARQYPERRPEPELEWVVLASGPAGLRQGDLRLRYRTLACELSAKAMVGLQRDGRLVPAGQGPRLWAAMPAGTTALEFVHQLLPPEVDGMPDPEDARFTAGCLGWTVLVLALLLVVRDRARARRAQAAAMASLQVIGPPRPAGAADPGGKGPGGIPGYVVLLLGLLGAYLAVQVLTGLGWIMAQGAVGLVGGAGVALAAAGLALARLPPDWLKPGVAAPGGG
jgi:hypothetical protein